MKPATAEIDLAALKQNVSVVRQCAPGHPIMAMVKGNGYGIGLVEAAQTLKDRVEGFGVARLEEALQLRAVGVQQPILILAGITEASDWSLVVEHQLQPMLHSEQQLALLEQQTLPEPVTVWVKVDSGMHRVGFEPAAIGDVLARLRACPHVTEQPVLITHLAYADMPQRTETTAQLAAFAQVTQTYEGPLSVANSAAILHWPAAHQGWVRPGIMLYGASPMVGQTATQHGLAPVMRLHAPVLAIRDVKAGQAVGYAGTWQAQQDTRVAVVAIGYGDGYPRHTPNGTPVYINGREYPRVGRVSMDLLTVDIGNDTSIAVGDEVELWGPNLPVERIADAAGTIAYELLCQVSRRVRFNYHY